MPVCLSLAIALQKALILVLCNNWKMLSEHDFYICLTPNAILHSKCIKKILGKE